MYKIHFRRPTKCRGGCAALSFCEAFTMLTQGPAWPLVGPAKISTVSCNRFQTFQCAVDCFFGDPKHVQSSPEQNTAKRRAMSLQAVRARSFYWSLNDIFLSTKISFGEMLSGEFARKDNYAQTTTETLKLPFWPTMAKDRGEWCAPLMKKPIKTYSGTHLNPFLVSFHFFQFLLMMKHFLQNSQRLTK